MAQNITLLGADYPDVPAVTLPITGGGTATFSDTRSVTYNLTGGASASVTPAKAITGQGFSVKLSAPTGYALAGVTVTMGGVDITESVFEYDEAGGGGGTPAISVVDTTDSHGGTVREITALDISDTTAVASDVAQGKYFYTAQGVKTAGTGSGGGPSATQHSIYFEFTDNTNTTITAYYDDSFISNAITATTPTTYGGKTVTLAQLDGVTWYEYDPSETWETLFDNDLTWSKDENMNYPYCWISSLGNTPITVGSVYRVTYNNTEYRCTAKDVSFDGVTRHVFGNPVWAGGTDDDSGVPFIFMDYTNYGAWSGGLNAPNVDSTYYFKIERLVTS